MDNEIVSLPVKENDERAIAQTQGKPTDHKTDSNNESMDEDNYVSQNPTPPPSPSDRAVSTDPHLSCD